MLTQTTPEIEYPRKRWLLLVLISFLIAISFGNIQVSSPFSFVIMPELSLSMSQFLMIYTSPFLLAIFSSIPGGVLGDRFGSRLVVGAGAAIIGIFGILRAYTYSFTGEFVMSAMLGIGWGFILPNLPKIISSWFPLKERGTASGIYITSIAAGSVFVFSTAVLFFNSNWRSGFTVMGILSLITAIIWWLFVKDRKTDEPGQVKTSVFSGIAGVLKSKNVWIIAVSYAIFNGGMNALNGMIPNSMIRVHNVDPSVASMIVSMITLGSIGSIIFPAISDRIGLRKPFLYGAAIFSFIFLFLGWYTAFGIWTWPLMLIGGLALSTIPTIVFTLPMELPDVSKNHMSSATGIITTLGNAGAFFIPSYLIAALETPDMNLTFLVNTILFLVICLFTFFLPETGFRVRKKRKHFNIA